MDFLVRAYRLQSVTDLAQTIVGDLPELIPGDNHMFGRHHASTRRISAIVTRHPLSRERFLGEANETGLLGHHPFWRHLLDRRQPIKVLSDMEAGREWRKNPFFVEVLREDRVLDHLNIEFGQPDCFHTVGVMRSRVGFSAGDRQILGILRAHLPHALENARFSERCCRGGDSGGVAFSSASALERGARGNGLSSVFNTQAASAPRLDAWACEQARLLERGVSERMLQALCLPQNGRIFEFRMVRDWNAGGFRILLSITESVPAPRTLSPREREVLGRLAVGRRNAGIARDLGMSVHTVRHHVKQIFAKLSVDNRTAAARLYFKHGGGSLHPPS
ncbi:MAG: response regulator transcription factor [Opitutales bacterium]|nr:response regulator transcription factor [Opitutales bacterium]